MDASPRSTPATHCGSGDQNCDSLAAEAAADDSSDGETDIDLSVVGTSLQTQRDETN